MIKTSRRGVLGFILASPAIVRATSLMPVRAYALPVLDDYEEGAWTADIAHEHSVPIYAAAVGRYVRIGNLVHVNIEFGPMLCSGTIVRGLPFTPNTFSSH
jgi:hypothetical protein